MMETVQLGKSTLVSSRLAYGCWRIAGILDSGALAPDYQTKGRRAIIAAYEAGFTMFDHADIYANGEAEKIFGTVLKEVPEMRDRILIASKCGIRPGDGDNGVYRYDFSAGHIIWSCEQSLKRLNTETIDLFQLHRPDYLGDPHEVAEALSRLRKAGKIREIGLSNFSPSQFDLYQKYSALLYIAHQVEISLAKLDRFQDGTLEHCLSHRITPMAWAPLGGGRLASDDPIDLREPNHAHRIRIRETMDLIARKYQTTRANIALAWLLKHPAKIIPIIGSTDPEKIKNLAKAADIELSREDWYALMEAGYGTRLP